MKPPIERPKAIAQSRRKLPLEWVDILVIAAIVLTLGAIVIANTPIGKSSIRTGALSKDLSPEISQLPNDQELVRARIKLANGGPWI